MESLLNIDELGSGMFSDVMDALGYRKQILFGFQRNQQLVRFIGRARTVEIESVETDDENIKAGLGFIGKLDAGDVLIVKGSDKFAYFGELMTRLCVRQGISGVVIDGLTRDSNYTHGCCHLPILAKGYTPVDIKGRGRVSRVDVSVTIGGTIINPNNLIFADNDAVCVVPEQIEETVIARVKDKAKEEKAIIGLIDSGITVEELLKTVKEF